MNQRKSKLVVKKVAIPHTCCDLLSNYFREMSLKGLQLHSIELKNTLFGDRLFCRFVKNKDIKLNYCTVIYPDDIPENLNKFSLFNHDLGWNLLCVDYDSRLFIFCSEKEELPHISQLHKEKLNFRSVNNSNVKCCVDFN